MPKTIYERSTRELMHEMASSLGLQPGQVVTATRIIDWFQANYPLINKQTILVHLVVFSTNDPSRVTTRHRIDASCDLLFRVASRQYRLYEPGKDPAPIRELVVGDVEREEQGLEPNTEDPPDSLGADPAPGSTEFLLERDLQRYLAENLSIVEPGLRLYRDDDVDGLEFDAGGGRRIDILAVDKAGGLVVIELKVSRGYDRVVGQLLRYQNWIRQNMAEAGQQVRGMIVCREMSDDLRLACASVNDVELFEYKLSVSVAKVPPITTARQAPKSAT